nr:MAG: nonstructural protein [Riboviria sp.]
MNSTKQTISAKNSNFHQITNSSAKTKVYKSNINALLKNEQDSQFNAFRMLRMDPDYYSYLISRLHSKLTPYEVATLSFFLYNQDYCIEEDFGSTFQSLWLTTRYSRDGEFDYDDDVVEGAIQIDFRKSYYEPFYKLWEDELDHIDWQLTEASLAKVDGLVFDLTLYPVIRSRIDEFGEYLPGKIDRDDFRLEHLKTGFFKLREYDYIRLHESGVTKCKVCGYVLDCKHLEKCGDVESNPGPRTLPPDHLRQRMIFVSEPPLINPHSTVVHNLIDGVHHLAHLSEGLIKHIRTTPIPNNFLHYGSREVMQISPVNLRYSKASNKIVTSKYLDVTCTKKGPVTVHVTPLEQALTLLVKAHQPGQSAYHIPIYLGSLEKHKYYHKFNTTYTRKDGKIISLHFTLIDSNQHKPLHNYIAIPDLKFMLSEYTSFCASKYFCLIIEKAFLTGERNFVQERLLSMLNNNALITNSIEVMSESSLKINIYAPEVNFSLVNILREREMDTILINQVIKAPLKKSHFELWLRRFEWHKLYNNLPLASVRWNDYGVGSAISFGEFEHKTADPMSVYFTTFACWETNSFSHPLNYLTGLGKVLVEVMRGQIVDYIPVHSDFEGQIFGLTHLYKQCLINGLAQPKHELFKNKIPVCALCYSSLKNTKYPVGCCISKSKMARKVFVDFKNFEGAFNYWFQKIIGINKPTLNTFLFYSSYDDYWKILATDLFELKVEQGTMIKWLAGPELNQLAQEAQSSITSINSQLNQTQSILNEVDSKKLVARVDSVVGKLERFLPGGEKSEGLSGMIDIIDATARSKINGMLKSLFPLYDEKYTPSISIMKIARDYILMKHVESPLMKTMIMADMLDNAGLFSAMSKFFYGFEMVNKGESTTAWSDVSDWMNTFLRKPKEWVQYVGGFIGGFVTLMSPKNLKVDPSNLLKYVSDVAKNFRDISAINSGINAIQSLYTFIAKVYYCAKEYVYKLLGKECQIPMYVHLNKHLTTWSSSTSTLLAPAYRNVLLGSPDAWPLIDEIHLMGVKLLAQAKNNALTSTMSQLLKDLTKLRSQISLKRGIRKNQVVPLVVHLCGLPKIGKSALVLKITQCLSDALKLNPDVYMHNETLRFMDGYGGNEIVVCDDVNLNKSIENAIWLIKVVSPNLCILPTATNEDRPLLSNIKLIILTSNVEYSPVCDASTTDGIDRRSEYKIRVNAKHFSELTKTVDTSAKDFSWNTEHIFERISSVRDGQLAPKDQFKGELVEFLRFITTEAKTHYDSERERIRNSPEGFYTVPADKALHKLLMDGITPGNTELDLSVIRSEIDKIKFITPETFLQNTTADNDFETNREAAIFRCLAMRAETVRRNVENQQNFSRCEDTYPELMDTRITFTGKRIPRNEVTIVDTEYLYGTPFTVSGLEFDYYFLHHLNYSENSWYINKYYKRNEFPARGISVKVKPSALDYHALESLILDQKWYDSWYTFFSLSDEKRYQVYEKYLIRIRTLDELVQAKTKWGAKISNFFKKLFSKETGMALIVTALAGFVTIAGVAMTYEAMTSILVYDTTKKMVEKMDLSTSQPGKVAKPAGQHSGVQQYITSATTDQCYVDVRNKIIRNVYLAQIPDLEGKITGTFNITFIGERYALINHHAIHGLNPLTKVNDRNMCAIDIYSTMHNQWIRYYFNRKYYRFPNQDLGLIFIPQFQAQSNIIHLFLDQTISPTCRSSPTETIYHTLYKMGQSIEIRHGKFLQLNEEVLVSNNSKFPITYQNAYCIDVVVPPGSSGGPVLLNSPKYQSKLIGIQSSSGNINSHAVRVTQQQLKDAMEYYSTINKIQIGTCSVVPQCDVGFEPVIDPNVPSLIGIVDPSHGVTISPKTQLRKTPWFGKVIEPPQKTPVLSRVSKEDRYLYVNKTEKTQPITFDQYKLDQTVEEYSFYLKSILKKEYGNITPSILSLHQVLNGEYIGGKSIDLSTSPGIGIGDWIHTRQKSGQHDFAYREGDTIYPTEKLSSSVSTVLSECMIGKATTSTYASFPKDELRNKDARGIDGAPIEQKEVYKMLFGALDGLLSSMNRGQLKYGLGIDLFSSSGVNLLSRISPNIMMWDFSNYDGSITYQMYEAAVNIYNNLSGHDEFSLARHTLAYKTCYSTIIADNKVYQPLKGMRSGFGGTSSFNTHIHNLFLIMAVKDLLRNQLENPTLSDVLHIVDWITFGDDGLAWLLEPCYSEIINGETIAMKFMQYGLLVSDPRGKSTLPPKFVDISEASFLKQSPYWDENLNIPVWRVGEECLQSVFSYYSGEDPMEPLDCAFRMLWPYGRDRYEQYRKHLNVVLRQKDTIYAQDWYAFRDLFSIQFHGATYTGRLFSPSTSEDSFLLD